MSVEEVANKYRLPDLHRAIVNYLSQPNNDVLGSRHQVSNNSLPLLISLKALEVWTKARLQNYAYHSPHDILPPQTINASPPSELWPSGHLDAVIINRPKPDLATEQT
jgi:hypothetical protein